MAGLLKPYRNQVEQEKFVHELIWVIQKTTPSVCWSKENGLQNEINYYPMGLALVIRASPEVIDQIKELLDTMEAEIP